MKLVFLGAPGAGKGTIAEYVVKKYGIPHIATGDIFRANISEGTELGRQAQEYTSKGHLVPDEITIGMVKERLGQADCANGYLLDGFPRTVVQAEALDGFSSIDVVVNFIVADDVIIKRLSNRRSCATCNTIYNLVTRPPKEEGKCDKDGGELCQRDDDTPEVISKRLATYREQTAPLIDFYKKKGNLMEIDAERLPDEIAEEVIRKLEEKIAVG